MTGIKAIYCSLCAYFGWHNLCPVKFFLFIYFRHAADQSLIIFAWRYFMNSLYCFQGKVVLSGDFEVQQGNVGIHGRLSRPLNLQSEPVWWCLTLQVNTRSQPEKKGVSAPTRQTPTTPTSAPKSSPMQQHGPKAKVALPGPSLLPSIKPELNLLLTSNNLDHLLYHLIWVCCHIIILSTNSAEKLVESDVFPFFSNYLLWACNSHPVPNVLLGLKLLINYWKDFR